MEENKNRISWDEYLIYAKVMDLFICYRNLKGSQNVNNDIRLFLDSLEFRLIDNFGKENFENGGT